MNSYEVPNVMDYVIQTAKTYDLQHNVKEWKRKVEIASQENAMLRKEIQQMQDQVQKAYIRIKELIDEKNSNS